MEHILTTKEVAGRLGVGTRRVIFLITTGRLLATKVGNLWLIQEEDLSKLHINPTAGRPKRT